MSGFNPTDVLIVFDVWVLHVVHRLVCLALGKLHRFLLVVNGFC